MASPSVPVVTGAVRVGRGVRAAAVAVRVPIAVPIVGPTVAAGVAAVVVVPRAAISVSPAVVCGRVYAVRADVVTEARAYEEGPGAVVGTEAESDAREEPARPDADRDERLSLDRDRC